MRKLIFSLRLLSCTVRSLFDRMTVLSTLCGSPVNRLLEKEALTRLQDRTTQKRRAGHQTVLLNFGGKAEVQRILREVSARGKSRYQPQDELLSMSHIG